MRHANEGHHRLARPIECVDCGVSLDPLPAYFVTRCGPGFFYHCVGCGERRPGPRAAPDVPKGGGS